MQHNADRAVSLTAALVLFQQFVPAFVLPTLLWLLGNVLHLIRSTDFNTYPRHNVRVNNHLRIDAWLELMIGVGWLAFPGQISALLVVSLHYSLSFLSTQLSCLMSSFWT